MRKPQLEYYLDRCEYLILTYPTGRKWEFEFHTPYTYHVPLNNNTVFTKLPAVNRWTTPTWKLTCVNCRRELWAHDPKLLRLMAVWGYVGVVREC